MTQLKRAIMTWLAGTLLAAGSAHAGTVTGLYNTGVASDGTLLGNMGTDSHYVTYSLDDGSGTVSLADPEDFCAVALISSAPGSWLAADPVSTWIAPYWLNDASSVLMDEGGNYDYRLTIGITGDASALVLMGRWAVDDGAVAIQVNGTTVVGGTPVTGDLQFAKWAAFTLSSGFVTGTNTIDFVVENDQYNTGLRVEWSSTSSVPEPGSTLLLGGGLAVLAAFARRRKRLV